MDRPRPLSVTGSRSRQLRHSDFLVWNCVPFHPHQEGRILSVRTPDTGEIRRFLNHLESLDRLLRPERIIAIGRRAEQALKAAGLSVPFFAIRRRVAPGNSVTRSGSASRKRRDRGCAVIIGGNSGVGKNK
jgi:hypothetical protein